ncbi:MAG: penicillin-binding protein 2 [Bacteroidetes bacterium]|nr:penicillin-binding protein 2 [Bacteroidota bacterium]
MIYNPNRFGNLFRLQVFTWAGLLIFGVLAGRLFYLQIFKSDSLLAESRKNAIRDVPVIPIRGNMFDRNGILLVDSYPYYSLTVTPKDYRSGTDSLISELLDTDTLTLQKKIREARRYSPFVPSVIFRDISFAQMVSLEEFGWKLSGINYRVDTKRNYPAQTRGSHIFGYLSEVTQKMIEKQPDEYSPGDITGGSGLEKFYESPLRGVKGHEFWLVNATGQLVGSWEDGGNNIPAVNGDDLYLTIDDGLQSYAELLMEGKTGGAVAIDPRNGEILALVSKPDFNLNQLSGLKNSTLWRDMVNDPSKPLFNRATLTRYPPGSTFKPFVGAVALQEGIITEDTKLVCRGVFTFGNRGFKCHGGVHGPIDIRTAIQKSCNSFFYQLMTKIPLDKLHAYGLEFGMGQGTGVDIFEQRNGLIPSTEYYDRVYGKRGWTKGFLISLGIGQGEVGVSPIQSAAYVATVANGGTHYKPHFVRKIFRKQTGSFEEIKVPSQKVTISSENIKIIREGMRKVVEAGTAVSAGLPDVQVAGKTGTAQNPHGKDHAWFICFAPFDNPEIAISVMVENAGFGAVAALPVARQMLKYHFYGKNFILAEEKKLGIAVLSGSGEVILSKTDSLRIAD